MNQTTTPVEQLEEDGGSSELTGVESSSESEYEASDDLEIDDEVSKRAWIKRIRKLRERFLWLQTWSQKQFMFFTIH